MTRLDLARLAAITPGALPVYRDAWSCANAVLVPFGILATPQRAAHFLAQVLHESGGLTVLRENLNYRAARLLEVWPLRFDTIEDAAPYAHQPEALANKVYGDRLGNTKPGDGWRYRGRGLLQLTGRGNYDRIGRALGLDLVADPELVVHPDHALLVAAETWRAAGCNALADRDDVRKVTKAINGGYVGLVSRRQWLETVRPLVMEGS